MLASQADSRNESAHWSAQEIDAAAFKDVRLGRRCVELVKQLSIGMGGSIPFACQDWASTKAAYRFLSNPKVSEAKILAGHFLCTRERFAATQAAPVLVLHDTTEFTYRR